MILCHFTSNVVGKQIESYKICSSVICNLDVAKHAEEVLQNFIVPDIDQINCDNLILPLKCKMVIFCNFIHVTDKLLYRKINCVPVV